MEKSYVLQPAAVHQRHRELYFCFCGHSECAPSHSFGPAVRSNYIIHIILSGKGVYHVNHQTYHLKPGQGFLITPDVQTFYQADPTDPWTYLWIGFNGSNCEGYLNEFGIKETAPIFNTSYCNELKDIVLQMLQHNKTGTNHEFFRQGLLYQFFAWLSKDLYMDLPVSTNERKSYYVQKAIEYIQNNYACDISISSIAKYVCINRSYLSTLFKSELGISPLEYISGFRLSLGADLLQTTDLSIDSIAGSCGYKNPLVFSKAFKQRKGVTPSQYRKISWSKDETDRKNIIRLSKL